LLSRADRPGCRKKPLRAQWRQQIRSNLLRFLTRGFEHLALLRIGTACRGPLRGGGRLQYWRSQTSSLERHLFLVRRPCSQLTVMRSGLGVRNTSRIKSNPQQDFLPASCQDEASHRGFQSGTLYSLDKTSAESLCQSSFGGINKESLPSCRPADAESGTSDNFLGTFGEH
jgi:hypothetical protein